MNKLKADKSLWPDHLKKSRDFYNPDFDYYFDINYVCYKCGKPSIHTALEQKNELEFLKRSKSKVLCEQCFSIYNRLKDQLRSFKSMWENEKGKDNAPYLVKWYETLVEYSSYTKHFDQGMLRYLEKKVRLPDKSTSFD